MSADVPSVQEDNVSDSTRMEAPVSSSVSPEPSDSMVLEPKAEAEGEEQAIANDSI